MINQEFKAKGTTYQALPNFRICCRELGGSKLRVFAHACAVSALSAGEGVEDVYKYLIEFLAPFGFLKCCCSLQILDKMFSAPLPSTCIYDNNVDFVYTYGDNVKCDYVWQQCEF